MKSQKPEQIQRVVANRSTRTTNNLKTTDLGSIPVIPIDTIRDILNGNWECTNSLPVISSPDVVFEKYPVALFFERYFDPPRCIKIADLSVKRDAYPAIELVLIKKGVAKCWQAKPLLLRSSLFKEKYNAAYVGEDWVNGLLKLIKQEYDRPNIPDEINGSLRKEQLREDFFESKIQKCRHGGPRKFFKVEAEDSKDKNKDARMWFMAEKWPEWNACWLQKGQRIIELGKLGFNDFSIKTFDRNMKFLGLRMPKRPKRRSKKINR